MDGSSVVEMKKLTEEFFFQHWAGNDPPDWSEPWEMIGPTPNHQLQGCYAIATPSNRVVYVGVAVSRGAGMYRGFGLSNRINAHTRRLPKKSGDPPHIFRYRFIERWQEWGADRIYTIGFERKVAYLAVALEVFLINGLVGLANSQRPAS